MEPTGLILVLHSGFAKVNINDCINALPEEWKDLDREVIEIDYSERVDLPKLYDLNFGQFTLEHRRQFSSKVVPVLERRPEYHIAYFGLAAIPLTVDFGQLFNNYRNLIIFQYHHIDKKWYYSIEGITKSQLTKSDFPSKDQKGFTNALIRLGVSHHVNPEETQEIIPNAAEIDIQLEKPNEDALTDNNIMTEVAETVKSAFDSLSKNRSGLREIHLFAAIPCGLAFLVGSKISATIHPYIQTYQYSRTKEPRYKKAISVKGSINVARPISEKDKENASKLRELNNQELTTSIRKFCIENKKLSNGRSWFLGVVPGLESGIMSEKFWADLPAICDTSLAQDSISLGSDVIQNGFYWQKDKWHIDDNFFVSLSNRLSKESDIKKALRLFLFHEALHYKKHDLTQLTSINIGSFPKVLETADYQADVYAILNDYSYHVFTFGEIEDPREFFLNSISVATETMWSFDDAGFPLTEIQIRRLNRYMIWYWQYVRIEKEGKFLSDIIRILEEKPVIELTGLRTKEDNNRFFFELEIRNNVPLELAVFHRNKVIRAGSATNLPIDNLVDGVKKMTSSPIMDVIRSFIVR